jgi:hypothetical protein
MPQKDKVERAHHYFRVFITYSDGETSGNRVFKDRDKAERSAERQRKSGVVKKVAIESREGTWIRTRIKVTRLHVPRNSGVAVSRHEAKMGRWPDCVMRKPGETDEPLLLAHTIRHLEDVYLEPGRPDLSEPCYHEALGIYRSHADESSLDMANAVRSLAVLRWEQAKMLWEEVRTLYTSLSIEAGYV